MCKAGQIQDCKAEVGNWRVHIPFKGIQIQILKAHNTVDPKGRTMSQIQPIVRQFKTSELEA